MSEVYEIKRGYVKWTDSDGVFHKEPLSDHPELLAKASDAQQIAAEEARRLNAAAEDFFDARKEAAEDITHDTLTALKEAPADVLTTGQLVAADDGSGNTVIVEASALAEPVTVAPASAPEEPLVLDHPVDDGHATE